MLQKKDFQIIRALGQGSFGTVYLVRKSKDVEDNELMAMKVMRKPLEDGDPAWSERKILNKVKDIPHLIQMRYAFYDVINLFFVMELAVNGDLCRIINEEEVSEERAKDYIAGAIRGLEELHKLNIIHRDIKLENMLVDDRGFVKLTDFGLSKDITVRGVPRTHCGTPCYQAPEILKNETYDKTVDWWALGIALTELIARERMDNKKEVNKTIQGSKFSINARNIIFRLTAVNPLKRLGRGNSGTMKVKDHPFFEKKFWENYENRYKNMPHMKKEDIEAKMLRSKEDRETIIRIREELINFPFDEREIKQTTTTSDYSSLKIEDIITISDSEEEIQQSARKIRKRTKSERRRTKSLTTHNPMTFSDPY